MMSAASVDPVREQVEEALRQVVGTVTAVPCALVRRSRDAAERAVERVSGTVTTSVALARSMGELAFGSLLGVGRSAVAPPRRPPSTRPESMDGGPVADSGATTASRGDDRTTDHLPIDDYESLAASHVVARLARLSADELEQIREFEQAHRGRRTVLGKIEQLLNG